MWFINNRYVQWMIVSWGKRWLKCFMWFINNRYVQWMIVSWGKRWTLNGLVLCNFQFLAYELHTRHVYFFWKYVINVYSIIIEILTCVPRAVHILNSTYECYPHEFPHKLSVNAALIAHLTVALLHIYRVSSKLKKYIKCIFRYQLLKLGNIFAFKLKFIFFNVGCIKVLPIIPLW